MQRDVHFFFSYPISAPGMTTTVGKFEISVYKKCVKAFFRSKLLVLLFVCLFVCLFVFSFGVPQITKTQIASSFYVF